MRVLKPGVDRPNLSWLDSHYSRGGSDAVVVFDFDGVVASPVEDFVYRLNERQGEQDLLAEAARHYKISAEIYKTQYLRHLVLQAMLADQQVLPDGGPLLEMAKQLSEAGRPFFILSARSGFAAVERATRFLTRETVTPQETFFVGRVAKGRQLDLVRQEIDPAATVVYFEDSPRHSRNGHAQRRKNIATVFVEWDEDNSEAIELLERTLKWFKSRQDLRIAA